MNPHHRAARLTITGRVQGVFYRASCVQQAQALGLLGWVRNRRNGDVEAWVQGPDPAVASIIRWCHQGPPAAEVTGVVVEPAAPDPALQGFHQTPTA